jgi:hypothetical protein
MTIGRINDPAAFRLAHRSQTQSCHCDDRTRERRVLFGTLRRKWQLRLTGQVMRPAVRPDNDEAGRRGRTWLSSDFEQIVAHDDRAPEVDACGISPHLLGHLWVVRWDKVRKHQHLDACRLRHASGVFY